MNFQFFFNYGEGKGIQKKSILEHSKRWISEIFFNHGEGKGTQTNQFQSILDGEFPKKNSTMVKVKAPKRNQFQSILEGEFPKFSSTMVKVEQSIQKETILEHSRRWPFKILFANGEGKGIWNKRIDIIQ